MKLTTFKTNKNTFGAGKRLVSIATTLWGGWDFLGQGCALQMLRCQWRQMAVLWGDYRGCLSTGPKTVGGDPGALMLSASHCTRWKTARAAGGLGPQGYARRESIFDRCAQGTLQGCLGALGSSTWRAASQQLCRLSSQYCIAQSSSSPSGRPQQQCAELLHTQRMVPATACRAPPHPGDGPSKSVQSSLRKRSGKLSGKCLYLSQPTWEWQRHDFFAFIIPDITVCGIKKILLKRVMLQTKKVMFVFLN